MDLSPKERASKGAAGVVEVLGIAKTTAPKERGKGNQASEEEREEPGKVEAKVATRREGHH